MIKLSPRIFAVLFALVAAFCAPHETIAVGNGSDLVGKAAPQFADGLQWVNSKPLSLAELKGKAVFIRFWFGGCSMCEQSAPALNALQKEYAPKGLVVIGIHHPKGGRGGPLEDSKKVAELMKNWNINFPVALDNDWKTVNRFWLAKNRDFTSGSVLIDRNGVIQWVHPGGVLSKGSSDFSSLRKAVDAALANN